MNISVNVGGKTYGGYEADEFKISVDYKDYPLDEICTGYYDDTFKLVDRPDFKKALANLLLGKISKKNIKGSWSTEVIVYKGDKISRLHFQKIIEEWDDIDFKKTSFAEEIKKLERKYWIIAIKEKLRKKEPLNIAISFKYEEKWPQSGGKLVITTEVAKWLAAQLELATRGNLNINKNSIKFEEIEY